MATAYRPVEDRDVAVAKTGVSYPNPHFPGTGCAHLQVVDLLEFTGPDIPRILAPISSRVGCPAQMVQPSCHVHPAVGAEDLSGNEPRCVSSEKQHRPRDVSRFADDAERGPRRDGAMVSARLCSSTEPSSPVQTRLVMPVSTYPGATELTRTPKGPSSAAATRLSCMTPALATPYMETVGAGVSPPEEATLTIEPRLAADMALPAAAVPRTLP